MLYKANLIMSMKINLISPWYSWKIAELMLNNNHSLKLKQIIDFVIEVKKIRC